MKNVLGLDLGTNSIGWALLQIGEEESSKPAIKLGSRIIPMGQDVLDKFGKGVPQSAAADRTRYRGMRRLNERYLLRRERLFRILHILGFLPQHFDQSIGWDKNNAKTYGKFTGGEPKLAYAPTTQKPVFLFRTSFEEMLAEFSRVHPDMVADGKKIPYDWTQYYLRKKALSAPISKYELAWLILRFNQKRGYYQLRGEEEDTEGKLKEYAVLTVQSVEDTGEKRSGNPIYKVTYTNGMVHMRPSRTPLGDLVGKEVELIITTDIDEQGNPVLDSEGCVKRSFRAPDEDDWTLKKKRTESFINGTGKTVGEYIYDCILNTPDTKINGGYVQTIEREYYKDELQKILKKQAEFIPELSDDRLLEECLQNLYASNAKRRDTLRPKGMIHLILEDTLYYQRPLKSKKSEIANCPHEHYQHIDVTTGEIKEFPIKCIAKSSPYYQEFRLWQFVWNIRLYDAGGVKEENVTERYLPDAAARHNLFLWLNDKKSVKQDELLKYLGIKKARGQKEALPVRWNYVADKEYPCNETRNLILKHLKKAGVDASLVSDFSTLHHLWHILYSVEAKADAEKALKSFAHAYNLPEDFVSAFAKFPPFKKDYGAFSEKAIKRLLPMLKEGMQLWQAEENLYGKKTNDEKWHTPEEMKAYIDAFKHGSLRNPIVEQCILESLRTVLDIWKSCGHIDEIHVELGREMKNPADKRKKMTERIQENEATNMRIKTMLAEFQRESMPGVRPHSPMQQDILRIYEEGALQTLDKNDPEFKDIYRISHTATPSSADITRYKLWLEQRYKSPYTGRVIPLSRLFTSEYEIEHIIPRSRFFNDSFQNKVICEAEVNRMKTNMLALEFIKKCGGTTVETTHGSVPVLDEDAYTRLVEDLYRANKAKARNLLLEDIPEEFVQRQMNDSRYISKVVKSLLSAIVRTEDDDTETSKHVIVTTGALTDRLKQDWGLNDVWNTLVYPRFERMNRLTGTSAFGQWENKEGKRVFQTNMPLELSSGFRKKRIDHRHHAMDALVVACATRNIVNFLSNENAHLRSEREDLKRTLLTRTGEFLKPWPTFTQDAQQALSQIVVTFKNTVRVLSSTVNYYEHFDADGKKVRSRQTGNNKAVRKPLHKETFYGHVNLRTTKSVNFNEAIQHPDDIRDRELRAYIKGLFAKGYTEKQVKAAAKERDFTYNHKNLKKLEVYVMTDEIEPLVATRKALDETFDAKRIETVTDTGIQRILLNYLEANDNDPKLAFSPEGILRLNSNIALYNNGHDHKPIVKVRVTETKGVKFQVGQNATKCKKFVEAQSGTNLYFAIYQKPDGGREYTTIPLYDVIERMKQGISPVPEYDADGNPLLFSLSPNDLVYVPTEDEIVNDSFGTINRNRIYKFVSSNKRQAYFVPNSIANSIYNVKKDIAIQYCIKDIVLNEISIGNSLGKTERALITNNNTEEAPMIKSVCWKLETDRLGNIIRIIK